MNDQVQTRFITRTVVDPSATFEVIGTLMQSDPEEGKKAFIKFAKEHKVYWNGDSKKIGVVSVIKDYTNKKGQTFKAHYTVNGKYYARAKNDTPIGYTGNFEYNVYADKFRFKTNSPQYKCVNDFIEPIEEPVAVEPRIDYSTTKTIKVPKARRKIYLSDDNFE
jgi:hypothetical protein